MLAQQRIFFWSQCEVPQSAQPKADEQKHRDVCCSVDLPRIDSDWNESGAELAAQFAAMVEHVLNKDEKGLICHRDAPGQVSPRNLTRSRASNRRGDSSTTLLFSLGKA